MSEVLLLIDFSRFFRERRIERGNIEQLHFDPL